MNIVTIYVICAAGALILLLGALPSFLFNKNQPERNRDSLQQRRSLATNIRPSKSLRYHNVPTTASFLSELPKNGPVIATLVSSRQQDVYDVCTALKSLAFLDGDDGKHPAPVLIFNDGDLIKNQQDIIVSCTSRPIAFPVVDFNSWPIGLQEEMSALNHKETTHIQTLRFWTTGIWSHAALEPYETIMHIGADTCFKKRQPFLPNFQYFDLVYSSQYISPIAKARENAMGLYEFAQDFLQERYATNPLWWDYAKTSIETHQNLPAFTPGLEVVRKSFMLQPSVVAWHESMTETEPFGLVRNRWGLGVVRFMTTVMFAPNDMVRIRSSVDGFEQMTCSKDDVEKALSTLKK